MIRLLIVVLVVVAAYIAYKLFKNPDQNNDGKVDIQDVTAAAKQVAAEVKAEAVKVEQTVKKIAKKRAASKKK